MADEEETTSEGRTLEETPTWALATVCFLLIFISILIEHLLRLLAQYFNKKRRRSLIQALDKIKSDLMLFGFISLLLTVNERSIASICITKSLAETFLPCGTNDSDAYSDEETKCVEQEKVSFLSREGVKQLQFLIFILAFFHSLSSVLTFSLGMAKMKSWESWEAETRTLEYEYTYAVVWTTWEARNQVVFREKEVSTSQAIDMVKFRLAWWFKHHGKGSNEPLTLLILNIKGLCVDPIYVKHRKEEDWSPPTGSGLIFNVDGSALGKPGPAGIGGVLRDSNGKVLCLFSMSIGLRESNAAEVLAIHKACDLISSNPSLTGRFMEIISDSKTAVSWVKSEGIGNLNMVNAIYDIRTFMETRGDCSILYRSRASNGFADKLAKMGANRSGDFVEWSDPC